MRARTVLSAVAVAAVGASLVSLPSPAQAATSAYRPTLRAISAPAPKAMREAKGHLFVSTGNSVLVLSQTGSLEKTFTGMFGAAGMTVSPDGATVYVALSGSGQVAVVDTATLSVTSTWTTAPCTTSVALAGATLFYSYGCDEPSAQIGAVSTADGAAQDTGLADTFYAPPVLVVAGTTLLAGMRAYSPSPVTRYDISGSTLTAGTDSASAENLEDLAASPDGTSVATAAGGEYHLVTRSPGDLAQTGTFDTGPYPTAVAYSHNSQLIAGGLSAWYSDGLFVYNRSTGGKIVSGPLPLAGSNSNLSVVSGTVAFSDDDSLVYALAADTPGSQTYLVTSTTAKPKTTTMTLTVKSPAHVGNHLVATAHIGLPGVRVTFSAATNGKTVTHTATANSSGVATWTWLPTYSGTLTATYAGDVTHLRSSRAAKYRAPSTTTVQLSAGYKHRSGVTYYRSANKVAAVATVHPVVQGRVVTAGLYAYRSGHWTRVDSLKLQTDSHGRVGIYLTSARTKTLYKVTFTFSGDTFNTGSTASTTRFEIG